MGNIKAVEPLRKPQIVRLLREKLCRQPTTDEIDTAWKKHKDERKKCSYGTWHALRRSVVTCLHEAGADSYYLYDWMRWSKQRQFGMLPRYIKSSDKQIDGAILAKHPFVPLWQSVAKIIEGGYVGMEGTGQVRVHTEKKSPNLHYLHNIVGDKPC